MLIERTLDLPRLLKKESLFLLGPRQTGKTTLIREQLSNAIVINLLESDTFLRYSQDPSRLRREVIAPGGLVVIDEIQKLPELLNEVHWLMEERKTRFLLTGSSARKLRRAGVNLLGGRARSLNFHPFIFIELGEEFEVLRALNFGLIPSIYFSENPLQRLRTYCGDYLQQEILAEGLVRNLPAFSRFLETAALCQGKMINLTEISSDAQVKLSTVREYLGLLKDTLVIHELPAFRRTKNRKAIQTAKYFFFDVGVVNALQGRENLKFKTQETGEAFETYLFHELMSYRDYRTRNSLAYWRSTSGYEVDFILEDVLAVEVKAKQNISDRDLAGLVALREEKMIGDFVVVSLESRPSKRNGIEILPWKIFLSQLWNDRW